MRLHRPHGQGSTTVLLPTAAFGGVGIPAHLCADCVRDGYMPTRALCLGGRCARHAAMARMDSPRVSQAFRAVVEADA